MSPEVHSALVALPRSWRREGTISTIWTASLGLVSVAIATGCWLLSTLVLGSRPNGETMEVLDEAETSTRKLLEEAVKEADDICCARAHWDQPPLDVLTHLVDVMPGSSWRAAAKLAPLSHAWRSGVAHWRSELASFVWRETASQEARTYGMTLEELRLLCISCHRLRHLDIAPCHQVTESAILFLLISCPYLQYVGLGHFRAPDMSNTVLEALVKHCGKRLTGLDLTSSSAFNVVGLMAIAQGCPQLHTLLLKHCFYEEDDLPRRDWTRFDDVLMVLVTHCPQLTHLDLSHHVLMTNTAMHAIAGGCPKLRRLDMTGMMRGESTPANDGLVAVVTSCTELTELILHQCNADDATLHAIASSLPRLASLSVGGSMQQFSFEGLRQVALSCSRLRELNFHHNESLDDIDFAALAVTIPNLTKLSLAGCAVGDAGVAAIVQHCKRLTSLNLRICMEITDEAIRMIGDLAKLETLDLHANVKLTHGCRKWLLQLERGSAKHPARRCTIHGEYPGTEAFDQYDNDDWW